MVSQRTKERISYWANKFECPVDEDANYENTYVFSQKYSQYLTKRLTRTSGAIEI